MNQHLQKETIVMKDRLFRRTFMLLMLCCAVIVSGGLLIGCAGSDGANGAPGANGQDLTAAAKAETCTLCHAADAIAPPTAHPNLDANIDPAPYTATISSVTVSGTQFIINFSVGNTGFVSTLGDRVAPDATGAQLDRLAYLRFATAKLITNPSVTGETRWVSYNQGERTYTKLTYNGGTSYTYVTSALTATTGPTVFDATAPTRIGLQISTAAGVTSKPLQIVYDFRPDGNPITVTREIVSTAACAECHGTGNGIAHGTRYNAQYCAVCHTAETTRGGETVEFKSMVHSIHTSQTRGFLDASEVTYPQDILNCTKCHHGAAAVNANNWQNQPSIEACGSCHRAGGPGPAVDFSNHMGGAVTNADCTGCHNSSRTDKRNVEIAHRTINATTNNPNVPTGEVNFAYEINLVTASSTTTLSAVNPIIKFRILANENAAPSTPVTFATYTTVPSVPTMLTVGTHTFSGSPSFLVAYALPQEGLANNAATMNDYNNLGKAAAQPATISLTNLWNGSAGTLTGPDASGYYTATITSTTGKFPAGAKMRTVALQGYFTQVDTGDGRHALSVTGTVTGDVVRRAVVDPVKCGACHEWFEGHGGNRNIGLGSASAPVAGKDNAIVVCVLCHNPNLSSSGRGADPATVLSRMSTTDQTRMRAAGYNPADPSTYPEESQNLKDLIHATHASGIRTEPFRFVRDRGTSGVYYYDMSEVTFPGRIGDCEICHFSGTYNLPTTAGLLSSTYVTSDGNAATSVTTDRSTVPNANDIVTSPATAACITCHTTNVPVTHMNAQGSSIKVIRSESLR
jgi:OmcA/MtrC family decaheme c-type cytochrome